MDEHIKQNYQDRTKKINSILADKEYCTKDDGDCSSCSLVSNGRDCWNNPVEK